MQLLSPVPGNGPRVSSRAKLDGDVAFLFSRNLNGRCAVAARRPQPPLRQSRLRKSLLRLRIARSGENWSLCPQPPKPRERAAAPPPPQCCGLEARTSVYIFLAPKSLAMFTTKATDGSQVQPTYSFRCVRLTFDPELRAGSKCRPHCGAAAAATDECLGGSDVRPP